jgi:hypothetical protein
VARAPTNPDATIDPVTTSTVCNSSTQNVITAGATNVDYQSFPTNVWPAGWTRAQCHLHHPVNAVAEAETPTPSNSDRPTTPAHVGLLPRLQHQRLRLGHGDVLMQSAARSCQRRLREAGILHERRRHATQLRNADTPTG